MIVVRRRFYAAARLTGAILILALFALNGCGPDVETEYPVKGTVTLDGAPLADGEVYFRDEAAAKGSTMKVQNGQFEGKSEAGTYTVQVVSLREEAAKADATGYVPDGPIKVNIIPAQYNTNSKMTAEVKTSGPNEYKFEVTSK